MRGFLFDLDGTLVDTAKDMLAALKTLAAENDLSINPEYEHYKELITYGSKAIVSSIFGNLPNQTILALQARYLAIYAQRLAVDSQLFDGINTFIQRLDQQKIPWGIVTNKPKYLAEPLIKSLPQLHNCRILIGGNCTGFAKPHPEPIITAIKHLSINPQLSWYIGDALTDITAANAANMHSAVALWGYLSTNDKPETWQADKLLCSPAELLPLCPKEPVRKQ